MLTDNKPYSFNALAHSIANKYNGDSEHDIIADTVDFSDCSARVMGRITFSYEVQEQTYEHPGYCDISDVYVEISSVVVDCEHNQSIMTVEDKDKLEKLIKDILL